MRPCTSIRPLRVLHVIGGMNRGGAETWLMHLLRHVDRSSFRMDFLVHTEHECAHDEEIRSLGSQIHPCPHHRRLWMYARRFLRILADHGPFDIVHSHVHHFSGFVLWLASRAGVPCRVAHSHNDTRPVDEHSSLPRRMYFAVGKDGIRRHATVGLAASCDAAAALFGPAWTGDPRWRVLYYGIDLSRYRSSVDPDEVRADLGIDAGDLVLGHVGRFAPQKNHRFLLEVFQEAHRQDSRCRLLLIGDGALRAEVARGAVAAGLADRVIFTGVRRDVLRLMQAGMDVLVLPSFHEGLPLVVLEAQAAGLPVLASDRLSSEAIVLDGWVQRCALTESPAVWASRAIALASRPLEANALRRMQTSPFTIEHSAKALVGLYASATSRPNTSVEPA